MFDHLQIYNARERMLVGWADVVLRSATALTGLRRAASPAAEPRSILLLRLERIGDLLMTLDALAAIRARAPHARIHLVVGSWNAGLAGLLPSVDTWEALDAPWLARGDRAAQPASLTRRAWQWRALNVDLGLNLEPDIRSNALLALSGAARRVGFISAGGGSLLTEALDYDPRAHVAANLERLVDAALPRTGRAGNDRPSPVRLRIPDAARAEARRLLGDSGGRLRRIGVHASGGRPVKQWHAERFAEVAARLARERDAAIVLTGTVDDRPIVERVAALLPPDVPAIDVAGAIELPVLAGVLEELDLLVTGDTGPMHLAAAVGTPIVAVFGPSDPVRYGPLSDRARVVTADLWCRPCNRVRLPPARCSGRVPDCLNLITTEQVVGAARSCLAAPRG